MIILNKNNEGEYENHTALVVVLKLFISEILFTSVENV